MPAEVLSEYEREEIRAGILRQESLRGIAARLGRACSTVSREVARNGGRDRYRAFKAQQRADRCRRRPRTPKLVKNKKLARRVTADLKLGYSPAGIAARLRQAGGDAVSHETIYRAVYSPLFAGIGLQGQHCLRMRRRRRHHRHEPKPTKRRRQFGEFKLIDTRPPGAQDRSEAGHWEGDLIVGARGQSAIVTLVERISRQVILADLPHRRTSECVRAALNQAFWDVPASMCRTLTWDQGIEMTNWQQMELDLGIDIYFCHPHSPWERPSNEHTNRQLRYWLPKRTNLRVHGQDRLNAVANILNTQPRRLHNWHTPQQVYDQLTMQ